MRVHPANAEALRSWDGEGGAFWVEHDEIFDSSVARYDPALLAALGPADRVLDVGCGTGSITRAAARRARCAVGIDLSSAMLGLAVRRAAVEGLENVRFVHGDAQIHEFAPGSFDIAVSRTGVMFFGDPVAAFANIGRALRAGGRLAALVWQPLAVNEWMAALMGTLNGAAPRPAAGPLAGDGAAGRVAGPAGRGAVAGPLADGAAARSPEAPPGPFSLGDPAHIRSVLSAAGFAGIDVTGVCEPISFGPDPERAYRFFAGLGPVRAALDGPDPSVAARLRALVDAHTGPEGVQFGSAMWLITAHRP